MLIPPMDYEAVIFAEGFSKKTGLFQVEQVVRSLTMIACVNNIMIPGV